MYPYEPSLHNSNLAHKFFTFDSRSRGQVMKQVCVHIHTFENHPKVWPISVSMKSLIPRYTRNNSQQLGIYQYGMLIPVYTELYLVYLGMAEFKLSMWSRFQMSCEWANQPSQVRMQTSLVLRPKGLSQVNMSMIGFSPFPQVLVPVKTDFFAGDWDQDTPRRK